MGFTQPRRFMTPREVAPYLGGRSGYRTVFWLIRTGQLKAKRIGRGWRILPEWLEEYMSKPDTGGADENGEE